MHSSSEDQVGATMHSYFFFNSIGNYKLVRAWKLWNALSILMDTDLARAHSLLVRE